MVGKEYEKKKRMLKIYFFFLPYASPRSIALFVSTHPRERSDHEIEQRRVPRVASTVAKQKPGVAERPGIICPRVPSEFREERKRRRVLCRARRAGRA